KHRNVCDKEYKCSGCNLIVQRNDHTHNSVCGYEKCHNCKQENIDLCLHECFMQRKIGKGGYCVEACVCNSKSSEKRKDCTFTTNYIFFDYEAQQNTGTHIPNMSKLSDFPKTFGLTEAKKGYFPHFFNTPENQSYIGPLPNKSVFMTIYWQSDLSNSTIAVVKNVKREKFSDESIKWLKSKILNGNKNIKHVLNGGEAVICGTQVDGYVVSEKKCISIMDVSGMGVRIASTLMIQTSLIKTP
ncbi:Uncharacterized protein FWK35_00036758, partial [Aphis craccivora]